MKKGEELDRLFEAARNVESASTFEEVSERFKQSQARNAGSNSNPKLYKNGIIMTTGIIAMGVAAWLFTLNEDASENAATQTKEQVLIQALPEDLGSSQQSRPEHPEPSEIAVQRQLEVVTQDLRTEAKEAALHEKMPAEVHPTIETRTTTPKEPSIDEHEKDIMRPHVDNAYRFPVLSEEDIEKNLKTKAKMLKALGKLDKNEWAFVPSKDDPEKIKSFYMKTTEVTNLEYRTFLFDLLMQGRKDEFLQAKPDQSQWKKIDLFEQDRGVASMDNEISGIPLEDDQGKATDLMQDMYFSHPAYDQYPVVNISRKGAEMYCKWMATECSAQNEKRWDWTKLALNKIELPSDVQWNHAASAGKGKESPYPWGGPYTRNIKGCYMLNYAPKDTAPDADAIMYIAPTASYIPNDLGLYNCSGNVAEMIWYELKDGTKLAGTKGGHWMSQESEVQIDGVDNLKGITEASPLIGFRPIIPLELDQP